MIKFFRNVRHTLINEGKTSKYLKYAIGEIILVVIGILIALSINNWNEQRKNNIEEKAILESLDENFVSAKRQSEALISDEDQLKKSLIHILGLDDNDTEININGFSNTFISNAIWDIQDNLPVINTYFNLKNTNRINLIQNKEIIEKFTELEDSYSKLKNLLEDRLSVHQRRIDNISQNDINFIPFIKAKIPDLNIEKEIPNDYNEIFKEKTVRNLLGMKLSLTQDVIENREILDTDIEGLIELIQKELDKQN